MERRLERGAIREAAGADDGIVLQVSREMVYAGELLLVNAEHPVRMPGEPIGRLKAAAVDGLRALEPSITLEPECLRHLALLLEAAGAIEEITVVSGYRSQVEQTAIYNDSLRDNGLEYTSRYVALPGRSEHQTGLAVDVGDLASGNLDFIAPSFPDRGKCLTFKQMASRYGFIQRYTEGKAAITNIACEPWHFRYVGLPHARLIETARLCLEEYMEYLKRFTYKGERLAYEEQGRSCEIYYTEALKDGLTSVIVPRDCERYRLSGNNVDGFIVTAYYKDDYYAEQS